MNYFLLLFLCILPSTFILNYIYQKDKIEKEPTYLLVILFLSGIIACLISYFLSDLLKKILPFLNLNYPEMNIFQMIFKLLVVVAMVEEFSKWIFNYSITWNNKNFKHIYDPIVYSVFISLGFAIWENISYVLSYGFATAIVRAVTAIPGHACFGVFMGVFYALAKKYSLGQQKGQSTLFSVLAVVIPGLLHGTYDYIATQENASLNWYFIIFVVALFLISFLLIRKVSKSDKFLNR